MRTSRAKPPDAKGTRYGIDALRRPFPPHRARPTMRRIHLFELEDQPWFPELIRDAGTAYLRKAAEISGQAKILAPVLVGAMRRNGSRHLVDLCSGGAGPIPSVVEALASEGYEVTAELTDLYPNVVSLEFASAGSAGRIRWRTESVDATALPRDLQGTRTLFSALHHFRPAAARAILADAMRSKQPIAAFEIVSRNPVALLSILFAPIGVLLLLPFLRPFRPGWLVFTYLIPIIPLFVLWDGLVSCFRTYSNAELHELVEGLDEDGYTWEIGRVRLEPAPIDATYLLGHPRPA